MYTIYTISDPDTSDVVYVGQTGYPLKQRQSNHLTSKSNSPISTWVRAKIAEGKKPVFTASAYADTYLESVRIETQLIIDLKAGGAKIINTKSSKPRMFYPDEVVYVYLPLLRKEHDELEAERFDEYLKTRKTSIEVPNLIRKKLFPDSVPFDSYPKKFSDDKSQTTIIRHDP